MAIDNRIKTLSSADVASQLLVGLGQRNVIFLIGAGVSMVPPAYLPSGIKLKELVFDSLFAGVPNVEYVKALVSSEKFKSLIPEVAFSDAFQIIGNKLFYPFQLLDLSTSNFAHKLLAHFCSRYSADIFTTNFDLLIDRHCAKHSQITHLHGDLQNLSDIGVLLSSVSKSTSPELVSQFHSSSSGKSLYVVGYSGNDRDIIDLINSSEVKEVYWLLRSSDDNWARKNIGKLVDKAVYIFYGDLGAFFSQIGQAVEEANFTESVPIDSSQRQAEILLKFQRQIPVPEKQIVLSLLLARIQEYKRSCKLLRRVLASPDLTRFQRAKAITMYADVERYATGELREALKLLADALDQYPNENDLLQVELLNQMGVLHLGEENYSDAKPFFKRAIEISSTLCKSLKKHNLRRCMTILSQTLNNLGLVYYNTKQQRSAGIYFLKSIRLKKKIGHVHGEITSAVNLAMLYCGLSDEARFRKWEGVAIDLAESYSAHHRLVEMHYDIANILNDRGDLVAAHGRLHRALDILNTRVTGMESQRERIANLLSEIQKTNNGLA